MECYVLDGTYTPIGMIDQADSILWLKKYNDIGECEIYLPCSDEMLSLLKIGHYIYRYDDDMFCVIEKVEITTDVEQGDFIIATGRDICSILSGRIVRWQITFSGTAANFIKKLLTDNVINPRQTQRKIPNFIVDDSNFSTLTEKIEMTANTDDLLQLISSTCKTCGYGFRLSYDIDIGKLVFRLYSGVDRSDAASDEYIEFSPDYGNIISSSYSVDASAEKNVAYVGYKNTAEEFHLLSIYKGTEEPQGEARREIFVDGTGTSRDITEEELKELFPNAALSGTTYNATIGGEQIAVATVDGDTITVTDYTYLLLIRILGRNALYDGRSVENFSGEVDTLSSYQYKDDYDIGDIVSVYNDYGIGAAARIIEVMESEDNDNGYVVEPHFEYA